MYSVVFNFLLQQKHYYIICCGGYVVNYLIVDTHKTHTKYVPVHVAIAMYLLTVQL